MINFKEVLDQIENGKDKGPDFRGSGISGEQIKLLIAVLKKNKSVDSINLSANDVNENGVEFAKALEINESIGIVELGHANLTPVAGQAIAKALEVNQKIWRLCLENNNLGPASGFALAKALEVNETLTELFLQKNGLGDEAVAAIIGALKVNKSLKVLYLDNNNLGPKTAQAILEMLAVNKSLTNLSLGCNELGNAIGEAVVPMIKALEFNTSLTSISLHDNFLGPEEGFAFAEMLRKNKTLTSIWLSKNFLGPEAVSAIADALQVNTRVVELMVFDNNLCDKESIKGDIRILTQRNSEIRLIRKYISALFPEASLKDKKNLKEESQRLFLHISEGSLSDKDSDSKAYAEEFDEQYYQSMVDSRMKALFGQARHKGGSVTFIQELHEEVLLARCSWDNHFKLETRITHLTDIIARNITLKQQALTRLAPIVLTKAMQCFQAEKTEEATHYWIESCTAALHGQQNEMTNSTLCDALSCWLGEKSLEKTSEQLLLALSSHEKFKDFEAQYLKQCKKYDLKPLDLCHISQPSSVGRGCVSQDDRKDKGERGDRGDSKALVEPGQIGQIAKAMGKTQASPGDSKSVAELDQRELRQRELQKSQVPSKTFLPAKALFQVLSLDEEEARGASPEAEVLRVEKVSGVSVVSGVPVVSGIPGTPGVPGASGTPGVSEAEDPEENHQLKLAIQMSLKSQA